MQADVTPKPKPQDGAAADARQRTIRLIENLLSTGLSVAEVLEETKRLADGNTSEPTVTTQGELSATEASAMGQQSAEPRRRGRIWLLGLAFFAAFGRSSRRDGFASAGARRRKSFRTVIHVNGDDKARCA
jgi:hypothetical protein